MSDPVWLAIIGAVQATVIVVINKAFGDRRAKNTQDRVQGVSAQVETTHKQIDGRMDQLIVASKAQGAQDQRAEDRQDAKDAAAKP